MSGCWKYFIFNSIRYVCQLCGINIERFFNCEEIYCVGGWWSEQESMSDISQKKHLFCFGLGFTGSALVREAQTKGWMVSGTYRERAHKDVWSGKGVQSYCFDGNEVSEEIGNAVREASHVLITIPPQKDTGDVVFKHFKEILVGSSQLRWLGYLSTTGVYGNRDGDWVDETSELKPGFDHQRRRVEAEEQWRNLYREHQVPVHIFRLAGIYGPGRNLLQRVRSGSARRIDQPGLVFNRVHVEDVVQVLCASIDRPHPGAIYNVSDDLPSSPAEAVAFACDLLSVGVPPLVALEEAGLSKMGRGFYQTNKKVRNQKIKKELGVQLRYPDYKVGLRALLATE
jgi:nucleoside-diphosphate-sugar epimerase